MSFFGKIWNFIKKPKVKIWLVSMAIVIFVAVSVMSLVMILSPVEFSKQLRPYVNYVNSISFRNQNFTDINGRELINGARGGDVDVHADARQTQVVGDIITELHRASRTNRFMQAFGGQSQRSEVLRWTNWEFTRANLTRNNTTYIEIIFDAPVYVILRADAHNPVRIEKFDSNNPVHENQVLQAIFIPLTDISNSFDQHVWHLRIGTINFAPLSLDYFATFTTNANYYRLFNLVDSLDSYNTGLF